MYIISIAKELLKPLAAGVVKQRSQSGVNLSYVEAWYVIEQLNEVFGFDGWDRQTINLQLIQSDQNQKGTPRVAYIAQCVLTVRFKNDTGEVETVTRYGTGFGNGFDSDPGKAHESAVKEAESDAMKRAAMTLGYRFGLALYDKSQSHVSNVVDTDDAKKLLQEKAMDRWKVLGGTPDQLKQLIKTLKDSKVKNEGAADFIMTIMSEGVNDLQGVYDYALTQFKIDPPFLLGGSAS
jgi:DNA repair and recombination protein RAD52